MGYYVNPPQQSKEQFLQQSGKPIPSTFKWEDKPTDSLPVVLCDNGTFTAAAIGYSKQEFDYFKDPSDPRQKTFFLVSIEALLKVSDLKKAAIQT